MSAGYVHTKASLMLTARFLMGGIVYGVSSVQYAIGALIGVMVTPDCDVDAGTIQGQYLRQRVGRVAEIFWDALWYFYRKSLIHKFWPRVDVRGKDECWEWQAGTFRGGWELLF